MCSNDNYLEELEKLKKTTGESIFTAIKEKRVAENEEYKQASLKALRCEFMQNFELFKTNFFYNQGTVVTLDVNATFNVVDDLLPSSEHAKKIISSVGKEKERIVKRIRTNVENADVASYEAGILAKDQLENGFMLVPSYEITLWSLLFWNQEFFRKFDYEKYWKEDGILDIIKGFNDCEKRLYLFGLIDVDKTVTTRFKTLKEFVSNNASFDKWLDEEIKVNEISDFPRPEFNGGICALIDSLGEKKYGEIPKAIRGLEKYWGDEIRCRQEGKLFPRFDVYLETLMRSDHNEDMSLAFYPKKIFFEGDKRRIASYYIGTYKCKDVKEFNKKEIYHNKFQEIVDFLVVFYEFDTETKVREILRENRLELKALAEKSARAAVMARNMSHNLGSHVLYQLSKTALQEKKYNLSRVFDYLAERMEFIAQYFTTNKAVVEGVYNFREFFDHFVVAFTADATRKDKNSESHFLRQMNDCDEQDDSQNYILKHLVRSEGFEGVCFSRECPNVNPKQTLCCQHIAENKGITQCDCHSDNVDGDMKNVCFKLDYGTKIENDKSKDDGSEYLNFCSGGKKYLIKIKKKDASPEVTKGSKNNDGLQDVTVSIPGGVIGSQAFYIILENFIRNTAKHANFGKEKRLRLSLYICEMDDDPDFYKLVIMDNVTLATGQTVKKDLDKTFNNYLRNGLVDIDTNEIIYGNWGLKEMQICAFFLAGRDIHREIKEGCYPKDGDYGIVFGQDEKGLLTLEMKLRRPKLLSVVKNQTVDDDEKKKLAKVGVTCFSLTDKIDPDTFCEIHNSQIVAVDGESRDKLKYFLDDLNDDMLKKQFEMGATSLRFLDDGQNISFNGGDSDQVYKNINELYMKYIFNNYGERINGVEEFNGIDGINICFKNNPSGSQKKGEEFSCCLGMNNGGKLTDDSKEKLVPGLYQRLEHVLAEMFGDKINGATVTISGKK